MERVCDYERDRVSYDEIIETAKEVFGARDYQFSRSIDITTDNPTLLFTISGGVMYEQVLAGDGPPPLQPRVASVQRCIRTDGLGKVGYSGRHHIAFDMLGHFSFFEHNAQNAKELALVPVYEFLQKLGVRDIFARYHPSDTTSKGILKNLGVISMEDNANTHVCNAKRRSGDRVEFGRFINGHPVELWNVVFTLYEGINGVRTELDKVAFDSGTSIDRLVTAANGKLTDYETALWQQSIEPMSGVIPEQLAYRISDFAKAVSVMMQSDVIPGSKKQGYIARKLFSELVRMQMSNPSIDMPRILRHITQVHNTGADVERLITAYDLEAHRIERMIELGKKAVQTRLRQVGGELVNTDYEYLKSTHGLDEEMVRHISLHITRSGQSLLGS